MTVWLLPDVRESSEGVRAVLQFAGTVVSRANVEVLKAWGSLLMRVKVYVALVPGVVAEAASRMVSVGGCLIDAGMLWVVTVIQWGSVVC